MRIAARLGLRFGLALGLGLGAFAFLGGCDGGARDACVEDDPSATADAPPTPASPTIPEKKPSPLDGDGPLTGDGVLAGSAPRTIGSGTPTTSKCRPAASEIGGGHADAGVARGPSADFGGASPAPSSGASSSSGSGGGGDGGIEPGTLTAGVWDDNRNFDRFLAYRATVAATQPAGLLPIDVQEHQAAHDSLAALAPKQKLDVSLVIDTTGSMGDEIAYLQKEFDTLAGTIQTKFPNSEQRWSLVTYKDDTDEYVVRWYDFRADTQEFRAKLGEQSAGGGGDFPEAADRAVDAATRLSWRADASVAKLMFWVADAPHHAGTEAKLSHAIRAAKQKGIHIYPVASSGIDELTELTMRTSAQITGGRYLFLTDDSGVGGAHKEASVPCFFVTKLDKAVLRMVDIEMSGVYHEPETTDIIRTGGDPKNGICQLDQGPVTIY